MAPKGDRVVPDAFQSEIVSIRQPFVGLDPEP
jgi:hypothetical protein